MCDVLQIPRSTYYYKAKARENNDDIITDFIIKIFKDSRNIYGQRKIKRELYKLGYQVSRRRIGRIMKEQGLVSKYTVAQFSVDIPKRVFISLKVGVTTLFYYQNPSIGRRL